MFTSESYNTFISQFSKVVTKHMAQGHVSLVNIAQEFHITRGQLNRRVKAHLGITAQQLAQNIRIDHAKRLLVNNRELPIADVAFQCGFDDATSFTRAFHRTTGCSPSIYRNNPKKHHL